MTIQEELDRVERVYEVVKADCEEQFSLKVKELRISQYKDSGDFPGLTGVVRRPTMDGLRLENWIEFRDATGEEYAEPDLVRIEVQLERQDERDSAALMPALNKILYRLQYGYYYSLVDKDEEWYGGEEIYTCWHYASLERSMGENYFWLRGTVGCCYCS